MTEATGDLPPLTEEQKRTLQELILPLVDPNTNVGQSTATPLKNLLIEILLQEGLLPNQENN